MKLEKETGMDTSATDQLKERIEALPGTLRAALERQAKARIEVARIEARMDKLEAEIARETIEIDGEDDVSFDNGLEDDLALLKLETASERVKLQMTEAEYKAEMEFRSSMKTTEGHVKAAVGVDPVVNRLRHELLDAKETARVRKVTLQRERQIAHIAEHEARSASRDAIAPENQELAELSEKARLAQEEILLADVEVSVAGAMIDIYRMIVQVESLSI